MQRDIAAYHASLNPYDRAICDRLARTIESHFAKVPLATSKVWHRHPVWFIDANPIVGYHTLKGPPACVRLLFWSGRSFNEPGLTPEGGFQTAGARYTAAPQIDLADLKRWLKKSVEIQWDYKNIVKRKGKLLRLDLPAHAPQTPPATKAAPPSAKRPRTKGGSTRRTTASRRQSA